MPIYEFECDRCGCRFEELVSGGGAVPECPECGSPDTRRRLSPVSPPSRQPRGAKVRDSEARRGQREAERTARLAETRQQRAAGNPPRPREGKGR
jgi:putative FmdB family regulatory protein